MVKAFEARGALRERAWFTFGCLSGGLRVSEILSLQIGDVIQGGRMVDRVTVARRHMKGKRQGRSVLLHPAARVALTAWLRELRARGFMLREDPLFPGSHASKRQALSRVSAWRIIRSTAAAVGIVGAVGTHSCRKTFAKNLWEATGHDLLRTQAGMGHADVRATQRYLSFDQAELDRAVLSVDW